MKFVNYRYHIVHNVNMLNEKIIFLICIAWAANWILSFRMFRNINNKMSILHIRGFYTVGTVVPDVEAGDDSLLLFGNHWLGLLKSLQQILKAANKMETKLNWAKKNSASEILWI